MPADNSRGGRSVKLSTARSSSRGTAKLICQCGVSVLEGSRCARTSRPSRTTSARFRRSGVSRSRNLSRVENPRAARRLRDGAASTLAAGSSPTVSGRSGVRARTRRRRGMCARLRMWPWMWRHWVCTAVMRWGRRDRPHEGRTPPDPWAPVRSIEPRTVWSVGSPPWIPERVGPRSIVDFSWHALGPEIELFDTYLRIAVIVLTNLADY